MAKYWPNSSFKILPQLQLQNLYQTLCSKSEQKLSFITKPQLQQQTSATSETVTTSTSFDLVSSHTRVTSIKCTKREWVSDKGSQWSNSGPIKKWLYVVFNDSNQIGNLKLDNPCGNFADSQPVLGSILRYHLKCEIQAFRIYLYYLKYNKTTLFAKFGFRKQHLRWK